MRTTGLAVILAGQFFIGQALARNLSGDLEKAITVSAFAVIETIGLLIQITEQMERFDRYIRAAKRPLQETPEVLNSVCMDVTFDVLFRVVDYSMRIFIKPFVSWPAVAEHVRTFGYVAIDVTVQRVAARIADYMRSHFAVPFKQAHDSDLTRAAGAVNLASAFAPVHVASKSADVGFVHFHFASQFLSKRSGLHCQADSVLHEPRSLLRDSDSAVNLIGANTILATGNHPDRSQPLIQTERAILKDGPDLNTELAAWVRALALPLALDSQEGNILTSARRTSDYAIRPATRFQILKAVRRIREVNDCLLECFRCFVRHDVRIVS